MQAKDETVYVMCFDDQQSDLLTTKRMVQNFFAKELRPTMRLPYEIVKTSIGDGAQALAAVLGLVKEKGSNINVLVITDTQMSREETDPYSPKNGFGFAEVLKNWSNSSPEYQLGKLINIQNNQAVPDSVRAALKNMLKVILSDDVQSLNQKISEDYKNSYGSLFKVFNTILENPTIPPDDKKKLKEMFPVETTASPARLIVVSISGNKLEEMQKAGSPLKSDIFLEKPLNREKMRFMVNELHSKVMHYEEGHFILTLHRGLTSVSIPTQLSTGMPKPTLSAPENLDVDIKKVSQAFGQLDLSPRKN